MHMDKRERQRERGRERERERVAEREISACNSKKKEKKMASFCLEKLPVNATCVGPGEAESKEKVKGPKR